MKKRFIILLLSMVCALCCALMLAACNNKHVHRYDANVVEPTCTEQGYTEHTCKCGDSYVDNYVDATGHTANDMNICKVCSESAATEGLTYTLSHSGESYLAAGMGTATDSDIYIASSYNGKPVTGIADWAFANYFGSFSLKIPSSVTSIGKEAFIHSGLNAIKIPSSVAAIGENAFYGCKYLDTIYVDPNNIAYGGIDNCLIETESKTLILGTRLSVIPLDGSVTSIGAYAFYGRYGLTSVSIPDTVTSIGNSAFGDCNSLESITLGKSVTHIGNYAFSNCGNIESITVDSGNKAYGSAGNCLVEIESKTLIQGCKNSIIPIDGSVKSIESMAFYECADLKSITIPDSVTSIGFSAFRRCFGLTSVTIGNSVANIGSQAFEYCSKLTDIKLPSSLTVMGENVFGHCNSIESITVDSGNKVYHSVDNCLIETENRILISGCKNSVIPEDGSVTIIGTSAFKGCTDLKSIAIPSCVTSIGESAFFECTGLTSFTIPDSVTRIGDRAFLNCWSLSSIILPSSLTNIGREVFCNCYDLTSVTIPSSVTSIDAYAFAFCRSLTDITFEGSVEEWQAIPKGNNWDDNTADYTVHCNNGSLSKSENE